ncbi:MAG: hypothetical protein EOR60_21180 [Mesorhizobium sp.]|nr:MAG: hypothetical protein EOR60_21180 [Mesorhizobium sp.]
MPLLRSIRVAYNSCRSRHSPKCQGQACRDWLAARQNELLPVLYHAMFMLPAEVAAIPFTTRRHLIRSCSRWRPRRLRAITANLRHLGAEIGLIAALHSSHLPSPPDCRTGWWCLARRHTLDLVQAGLLFTRARAVAPVSLAHDTEDALVIDGRFAVFRVPCSSGL